MREYIHEYVNYIDAIINNGQINNKVIDEHLIKISFFQHERFIHLCVTLFYAIVFIIFLGLIALSKLFIPIAVILLIFLILYIYHYFYLENHVQYMYKQYDLLKKKKTS